MTDERLMRDIMYNYARPRVQLNDLRFRVSVFQTKDNVVIS